ncbi:periplasmic energy transduction protein, TonB-related protein [Syntrophotalea carbinolica DSM 2380]|uniref:Periplasmic energy transduction protein, TonB-related protein n=1 Tax=Syntrophotalea carbinolica (strain DSM 2380 / NBRC 103641 / GraBd1) TaxID=338963 RepID=Q3A096_SYNC1|nr:TonB family protein [Syntrophotalea carbinolica]ABA90211.1 periplasmic energy transduction protein, TonB-related protein [Syntrophotalea carbinolica DSM 2380]
MTTPPVPPRNEPSLFWLLALSLALHAVVFVLFSGVFFASRRIEPRPVYYVDLSKMPVLNPQAGRPDGGPAPKVKKTSRPKATKPKPAAAAPKAKAKPAPPKKTAVASKPAPTKPVASKTSTPSAKARTSPAPKATAPSHNYQSVRQKLAAMREKQQREQELAALKNKIAALSGDNAGTSGGTGSGAPLGMPDGSGDEIGVDLQTWMQAYLKQNWTLSKYQVTRRDLTATVHLAFNAEGSLTSYRIVKPSGDATFDDSVKKAVLKARALPRKPGRTLQLDVVFNLKDLMD